MYYSTEYASDYECNNNIFPSKQKVAIELYDALSKYEEIVSVVLFGSSVTLRCTSKSDTDLAIRLINQKTDTSTKNKISEITQEICNYNADILWYDRLSKGTLIFKNIMKGVQIV